MRIAICTGGGDAPGLNAVIRAVVLSAHGRGWKSYGIQRGYEGLLSFNGVVPLGPAEVRGITHLGGTILGTTNRGNPFRYITRNEQGEQYERDRSDDLVAAFQASGFDALVSIGGDGSLQISHDLWRKGLPVVCVPKTIDNDVAGTQRTFGFDTAVSTATEALDKLHSTAESHDRVLVVELMGRYAGWISLYTGLSGSADAILLPEIPFDIEKVCEKVRAREAAGRRFSIVVVAEGARPSDGAIELRTGKETRTLVLGHLQRGGSPTTYDRLLALRFGGAAVRSIADGAFGVMVGLNGPDITRVPLSEVVGRSKNVALDGDIIATARELGISLGD